MLVVLRKKEEPSLLEDLLVMEDQLVETSLLEVRHMKIHLGLLERPLCESALSMVLPELVVEEHASMSMLLEPTLPVVEGLIEVVEVGLLVVGVGDGSATGGGSGWRGPDVPIIGGVSPRMKLAGTPLPDAGGAFFAIKG